MDTPTPTLTRHQTCMCGAAQTLRIRDWMRVPHPFAGQAAAPAHASQHTKWEHGRSTTVRGLSMHTTQFSWSSSLPCASLRSRLTRTTALLGAASTPSAPHCGINAQTERLPACLPTRAYAIATQAICQCGFRCVRRA